MTSKIIEALMPSCRLTCLLVAITVALPLAGCSEKREQAETGPEVSADAGSGARYVDDSNGRDWPGYGRTYGEQHFSPLDQINKDNVGGLGLAWALDLDNRNSATIPVAVDGVIYFATGYSVIHAVDAITGKRLWEYDPQAAQAAGINLRLGWGSRGLAWWNGKIYTATQDGRLIALDAKTGAPVWSVQTFDKNSPYYITGAPRPFDGKIIIGNSGTSGPVRGYVTAYDAATGEQLWRFYTVPGNPADGFENDAMAMAAKTWAGEWWKFGGGGHVWNAIAYDPDTDTVFLGVGSAYPWNRRARSQDQGDNLFVSSIVAVQGGTGQYKWHYQVNPGDTWDYDAALDIELADIEIDGKTRKVLLTAPKNGFFYVIDRESGELISAEPFAKVTWASHIDIETGRPVENPHARYGEGRTFNLWPSSVGAHSWTPMAYSPKQGLAYIPVIELGTSISDAGIDLENWQPPTDRSIDGAVGGPAEGFAETNNTDDTGKPASAGVLVAWDPVAQKAVWKVPHSSAISGGVMATGGGLVLQGSMEGMLKAYSADNGTELWSFDAKAPLLAAPISFSVQGTQYITILTGMGGTLGLMGPALEKYGINPRTQARRVLTFSLGGKATLPERTPAPAIVADPGFQADPQAASAGKARYFRNCAGCHGFDVIGGSHAPDLRRSGIPLSRETFVSVVRDGALVNNGMPAFGELTEKELDDLRQYIRAQAAQAREQ